MLYDVETPEQYLEQLSSDDWRREKVNALRALIKEAAPELDECIHYKMLGYGVEGKDHVFHLNAQKNYVSLYVGDVSKIDHDGTLLEGLNVGKGCIRLTKTIVVADTRLYEFINRAVRMWRNSEDISC